MNTANNVQKLVCQLHEEKKQGYKNGIYYITQTELAYNSNRIEGSKLSPAHTRHLFATHTLIAERDEVIESDDIIETLNHFRAFDYILQHISDPLSEDMLKNLHRLLQNGTSAADLPWFNVGEYKQLANTVGETETTLPELVPEQIKKLLAQYGDALHTLDELLDFHVNLEKIHPFQDGNGRVGRLILFKECLRFGIVPFIIDARHKEFYYRGLRYWVQEKGYLRDTCLSAQDVYILRCRQMVHKWDKGE